MSQRLRFALSSVALLVLVTAASSLEAQDLPDNWQSLPPAEFVDIVEPLQESGVVSLSEDEPTTQHAANLILSLIGTAEPDYALLARLERIGRRVFHKDADEKKELIEAIRAREDDWTGRPYADVRAKITLMGSSLAMPFEELIEEAKKWKDAGGQLADVAKEDLGAAGFVFSSSHMVSGSFAIRWEGSITAPQAGEYTFSVSSVDINGSHEDYYVDKSMSVSVGGQQIISANPADWSYTAQPISLQAGEHTPVQVDLSIEASPSTGVLHAMLLWSGPGIETSIIPDDAFTPPDGEGTGLEATYTWRENGQFQRVTRNDPSIDFVWGYGRLDVSATTEVPVQANAALWSNAMSAEVLDELEASGEPHSFFLDPEGTSSALTSAQRRTFLRELVVRPSLIDQLTPKDAWKVYRAFRYGAVEEALDFVGLWTQQHADHAPNPTAVSLHSIDGNFRDACRRIGHFIAHGTSQADDLRDGHLELADGSCCLPIAYILNYSYLTQGRLDEWIADLDSRLDQPGVTGDQRANWLIARGHAEEIRQGPSDPFTVPHSRWGAARPWLDQALADAQSAEVKARATKEIAARLIISRQYDEARAVLQEVAASAPVEIAAEFNDIIESVNAAEANLQVAQQEQAEAADQAYLDSLQRRRDRASAAGNTEAVARYDALIQAASGE